MLDVAYLKDALTAARQCAISNPRSKHPRRARAIAWVECLADQMARLADAGAEGGDGVKVFWKYGPKNREAFGLNELLYDVCICQTDTCESYRGRPLRFITRCLWQIESELAKNSADAVKDFNKLVIGRADNKLFVGPRIGTPEQDHRFLERLKPVARCCVGDPPSNVYVALVPHPKDWEESMDEPALWRLIDGEWAAG
jgi:hypothetical protein